MDQNVKLWRALATVEIPMKLWACKGCLDYGRTFGTKKDFCSRCGGPLVHKDMTFVLEEQSKLSQF